MTQERKCPVSDVTLTGVVTTTRRGGHRYAHLAELETELRKVSNQTKATQPEGRSWGSAQVGLPPGTLSSAQSLSRVRLFVTPRSAARQASLSITNSRSLLKHVHQVGDAIQPSHPLSTLLLPPPIPPSIRVFSNESALHIRGPKCCGVSASNQSFQ